MSVPLGEQRRRRDTVLLGLILVLTYALSAAWSLIIPPPVTDASTHFFPDETSHADSARYLAAHATLPPYTMAYAASVHPPLYHGMAAILLTLTTPVLGVAGALIAVRLATAFAGVGVVYLTYQAARHFGSRTLALTAAVLVALIPTRAAIGGGILTENLAALGAAGTLAVLVGGMRSRDGFTPRRMALLTLYLVVGIGSKLTCLGLLPIAVIAVIWKRRWQARTWASAIGPTFVLPIAVAVAWAWWFVRNQRLYGDPFRRAAADRMWNQTQPGYAYYGAQGMSAILYVRALIHWGWQSFWGVYDGFARFLPVPVYVAIALFQVIAVVGFVRLLRTGYGRAAWRRAIALLGAGYVLAVTAIYGAYNWSHFTPQGRYFFVVLLPFGIVTALGWRAACPVRWRTLLTVALLSLFGLLNVYCLCVMPGSSSTAASPI